MSKKQLILLTGAYRFNNLYQIADSIFENFRGQNDINILWAICYDQYNGVGDLSNAFKYIGELGINWIGIPVGLDGQKNYGGYLYNDALKLIKDRFYKDSDPWIYILDDDNVICPLMTTQLTSMLNCAEESNRPAIWMSKLREDGFIDSIRYYYIYAKGMHNNITYSNEFMPDPSQLIIRYSLIEKMGFYDYCFEYDQKLWRYFYDHSELLVLPEDWLGCYWADKANANIFQCFHDGIMEKQDFDLINNDIAQGNIMSFNLVIGQNERTDRFVIPKEMGVKIFKMIEDYNKDKKYI